MPQISLDGEWSLYHFPEGTRPVRHPDDLPASGLGPLPALVPGNVELDLERAGLLPDPFYAENMRRLREFETHEWWYVRTFRAPAELSGRCELVFEGLDTLADVWLNGVHVGRSDDMLIEHRFDATAALRAGEENTIAVRLGSAMNAARAFRYEPGTMSWEHRFEGLHIRKAPHVWGWDIMPRAVSAGIWRPVRLRTVPPTELEEVYYWTADLGPSGATLGAWVSFRTDSQALDGFSIRFRGVCGAHEFTYEWPMEFVSDYCMIPVSGARLWWPAGYGEPNLYTVTAQLLRRGEVLAERVDRVGLRKVDVDRTEIPSRSSPPWPCEAPAGRLDRPPRPESHFVIRVNGEPVMVKGTNWVPLDAFHSRDAARLDRAMALVRDLGCNMIRCWGGNVYECDAFFDACDESGVMVWQDFAFACCLYPQDEEFLARVGREAEAVARRLRNHACLVVWCGDNEVDQAYVSRGLDPERNRITREALPRVLGRSDPQRAYIPSSPCIAPAVLRGGDASRTSEQHLWGPRNYFKSPFYAQHTAHFIGEIGYHGCPSVASMRRFLSPAALEPPHGPGDGPRDFPWRLDPEWQLHSVYHWGHGAIPRDRIELMANQVRELFGEVPPGLAAFSLASQIAQAEALKFFIESARLRKWDTSGILWWNLLDGWPQFSDAVVDYYFTKKLAYHYIRRVQRPVCVMLGEPGPDGRLGLVAGNDSLRPAELRYRVSDADSGLVLAEGAAAVPANWNLQIGSVGPIEDEPRLCLVEWELEGERFGNHYLAARPPIGLERYRGWLPAIAALPRPFDRSDYDVA